MAGKIGKPTTDNIYTRSEAQSAARVLIGPPLLLSPVQ